MIKIREANQNDIEQLIALNKAWQHIGNNDDQKIAGFLLNAIFSKVDLKKIIDCEEITIAEVNNKIIGYYLIDNCSETENLKHNRELIQKCKDLNLLDHQLRIGSRAQAVIDINYHNQGISRMMFDALKVHLVKKFDALFTVVSKLNPKIIAHQKVGWQVIHEDDDWFYVLYNL